MSSNIKKSRVPFLRFPEFRNAGEWEEKPLEEVAPLQRGFDLTSSQIKQGGVPVVYSNGVQKFHNMGMAKGPGLVTGRSGTIGKIHFIEAEDYWPHNTSLWVTSFKNNHPKFVYYLYKSIGMSRFASGSGVPTLNRNDVHAFHAFLPSSFKEQQKIADCLSSIDALIEVQNQEVKTLKSYKQGLMQQLFPREGETIARLRFPEFRNAGEWKVSPFGEIAKLLSGGTPSKDVAEYWGGSIPWISASSMHSTNIEKSDSNITELAVRAGARIAKKGTLLLLVRGSMLHKKIPLGIAEVDVAFNQDVKAIELKESITEKYMMYYLMASESKLLGAVTATGIGAGKLDTSDLNSFLVSVPILAEQQKIAAFLTNVDSLIARQSTKLQTLKKHKKGLMQAMFCSADNGKEEGF